ncbi:MAG: IclR family transcriptional regulator [Deltaproteobacteria bacterium]|nr:IclR family transcriptional regulator [Deltaproteobacteria bacterium]
MVHRDKSDYVIQSVSHALDVVEQFFGVAGEIGVTELSKRLKLHKNNVFRLLATLEARGYIEQNKMTENYRLGLKCLQLGQTYAHQMGFLLQAKAILDELVKSSNESSFVAVKKGTAVVPVDFVESQNAVRVVAFLGLQLPLHCTACGKVHLAFDSDEGVGQSLPDGLARYTDKTIIDRERVLGQLREVRDLGYAVEQGEFMEGVASVAVPVRDYTRNLVGSLAITGPAHRLTSEKIHKEIAPLILRGGGELSNRLGYQG